jgi:nitrate reductase gamma subunit
MIMDWWIEFAKGPLFALTFLIMVFGLLRHVLVQLYYLFFSKRASLKNVAWKNLFSEMATWIIPVGHLIKGTAGFSIVSFIFHLGLILVSVFLIDHMLLWNEFTGLNFPSIGRNLADIITIITIASVVILLCYRTFVKRIRSMSTKLDYLILIMILLPLVFGLLAGHPQVNPLTWQLAMLLHLLTAEALFLIIPFTKLAHIVLFFFDRLSPIHWQLKPGSGDKVAAELFGKEAKV